MRDIYLAMLEEGYFEAKFAFDGLADEHVWKRPGAGLLSIGEIAGHVAYWESARLAGEGGNPGTHGAPSRVSSPLIDPHFSYYPKTIAGAPSDAHLALTAQQVCSELLRVHEESVAHFRSLNPDLESHPPGWETHWTYRSFLTYASFHIAYHTGQMYTARHLLGEATPDN